MIDITSGHNISKNNKNLLFSAVLSWFHLAATLRWSHHDLGVPPLWNNRYHHVYLGWVSTDLLEVLVQKCLNHFEIIWPCYDLEMTSPWPWNNSPIKPHTYPCHHVYLAWVLTYNIYFYTTLKVKDTLLLWPLVTLSMHWNSADHLKVTWYIIRLKKIWSTKAPRGEGGTGGAKV